MSAIAEHETRRKIPAVDALREIAPGVALASAVAVTAYALRLAPGLAGVSPMILAIAIGAALRSAFGGKSWTRAGTGFAMRRVLRLAIVLLGFQLTWAQVAEVGASGVAAIAATLVASFLFTTWFGRLLGVERRLAELIAAGTSICGASAVAAANTVTRAGDEDVAYAVACVTVFGSVAMAAYPFLGAAMGLGDHGYGLWAGASIHEVAQVVAAGFAKSRTAGEFATVSKLTRVAMLAPFVLTLGLIAARRSRGRGEAAPAPLPWFVAGFVAVVALNSIVALPAGAKEALTPATAALLTIALAAMGLETDVAKLKAKGLRPFALGLAGFLFIAVFGLAMAMLVA